MESVNWHQLGGMLAIVIAVGGVIMAILKGFFVTNKRCDDTQAKCQATLCKKIDEVKDEVSSNRKIVSDHYAEIGKALGRIQGRLDRE